MTDYAAVARAGRAMPKTWIAEQHRNASAWALDEGRALHRSLGQHSPAYRGRALHIALSGRAAQMINGWAQ